MYCVILKNTYGYNNWHLVIVFLITQGQLTDILSTAQNLVLLLRNSALANVMPVSQGSTGEAAVGQGAQSVPTVRPQRNDSGQSVKQEMAR